MSYVPHHLPLSTWVISTELVSHVFLHIGFPGGAVVKNLSAIQETWVQSLGQEEPLEKGMATHSSILAWESPWTEEPGRLQSMGSQRVRYDWAHSFCIDFGIDHLVMSMCRVVSCVVGRGHLPWPVHSLGKTLLAFALLHLVFKGQTCLLLHVSLDFQLLHSNPLWWKEQLFVGVSSRGLISLHRFYFSFVSISGWSIDLDYYDVECPALEMNGDHSVFFETTPKYYISDSFVDYER